MAMVRPLYRLMRRRELTTAPHVTISSFNYVLLGRIARLLPGLHMGFLVSPDSVHGRIGQLGRFARRWSAIHPQRSLVDAESVEAWHERGWTVSTWTVNEPDEARRVADAGVDVIISDAAPEIQRGLSGGATSPP
jgi:glycerophosphoryl diester phosphodiesterase